MQKKFCWRAQTFSKICNNPPPFPPSPPAAFIHHHSDWHGLLGRYTQTMAFQKVFKATQHCLKLTAAMEKCIIDILRENENAEEETLLGNWLALSELQQSIACCHPPTQPTHLADSKTFPTFLPILWLVVFPPSCFSCNAWSELPVGNLNSWQVQPTTWHTTPLITISLIPLFFTKSPLFSQWALFMAHQMLHF